jgi:hypothetical protein
MLLKIPVHLPFITKFVTDFISKYLSQITEHGHFARFTPTGNLEAKLLIKLQLEVISKDRGV